MRNGLVALVVAVCLVASGTAVYFTVTNPSHSDDMNYEYLGRIAPYLHEIEFDDYIDDPSMEYVKDHIESRGAGCSSARNGDFVGRNFDYFYNDVSTFVIRMNASENRFASIGVAQHWGVNEKDLNAGRSWNDLKYLPNLTLDGVNEKGVYINDNVVRIDPNNKVNGTNPEAELDVHFLYIPRYILDHAESATHALQLIKDLNITGSLKNKYYLHYMIADKDHTYIVEAFNNELKISEDLGTNNKECTMTNHYINLSEAEIGDDTYPLGIERRWILQKEYDMGSTFDGMFYLMQEVKYSNIILNMPRQSLDEPNKVVSPWFSDPELFTFGELKEIYGSGAHYEEYMDEWNDFMPVYQEYLRHVLNTDDRSIGKDWITIHNSTYDIKNFKLQVVIDEDYLHPHTFYLNK